MSVDDGLIYRTKPNRGYTAEAWNKGDGDARIRILKGDEVVREFLFPAYKVWNIGAHFSDIVDSEIAKNADGYLVAGSDWLGGNVFATEKKQFSEGK